MNGIVLSPQGTKCLICGTGELLKFKAYASDSSEQACVDIVECKRCSFAWQYPVRRDEQQSVNFFENAYSDNGVSESLYFNASFKRDIAEEELGFIDSLPVGGKALLDIGAGSGIFADAACGRGWNVTAVDPALDSSNIKNKGINLIKGSTDQIPKNELFDVVTLWDVIEHVTSPVTTIATAKEHLREGGWLVIETGNYKSLERINAGKSHWIYQLDHRWYFSPDSIICLLKEAGFEDFIFSKKVLRPGWSGEAHYAGPSRAQLLAAIAKSPHRFTDHLSRFFALNKAKAWDMPGIGIFTVAAQKPKEGGG